MILVISPALRNNSVFSHKDEVTLYMGPKLYSLLSQTCSVTGEALRTTCGKWTFLNSFFFLQHRNHLLNSTDPSTTHPTVWQLQKNKKTKRWKLWRYCTLALNLQNVHAQIVTDDRALATWNAEEMLWVQKVFNRGLKVWYRKCINIENIQNSNN